MTTLSNALTSCRPGACALALGLGWAVAPASPLLAQDDASPPAGLDAADAAGAADPADPADPSGTADLAGRIETSLPDDGFVNRRRAFAITLPPGEGAATRATTAAAAETRYAVFVGTTDLTDLFERRADALIFRPSDLPLPAGEWDLVVYRVDDQDWQEIHRQPLRVRNAIGLDRAGFDPRLDLSFEGPLAQGADPAETAGLGSASGDFSGQLDLATSLERGGFGSSGRIALIGVNHQRNALRAGELGDDAPRVDLSDYLLEMKAGPSELAVGHVSLGRQRHLASGIATRGARIGLDLGSRIDVEAGMASASNVVGWSNLLGFSNADHRLMVGSIGLEALNRPGGLRLEVSGLSGRRSPVAGFNQGVVSDAETGDGLAVRLTATDPTERLRFEAGLARSRFDNPADSLLSQGDELVEVLETTDQARYVEASLDVLRDIRLSETGTLGLTLAYQHERVDPQYRSLGAFVQSDVLSNEWSAQATIAAIGLQAVHGRSRDNLDEVTSVLSTRTRRTGLNAVVPFAGLVGSTSPWLPMVSWSWDRTRQFGEGIPEDGDFSASHVPDQVSRVHGGAASWQVGRVRFGYRVNHSLQDNRQEDRENADFANLVHGLELGVAPLSGLEFNLALDLERAENREVDESERTRRYGIAATWQPFEQSTLALSLAFTRTSDDAEERMRHDTLYDVHWSSAVPGLGGLGSRVFLRFGRSEQRAIDSEFDLDDRTAQWSVTSGLSLSVSP